MLGPRSDKKVSESTSFRECREFDKREPASPETFEKLNEIMLFTILPVRTYLMSEPLRGPKYIHPALFSVVLC